MPTPLLATAAKSVAGPGSTVARAVDRLPQSCVNVGQGERVVSAVAGGVIALLGFTGRGPGILSTLVGGSLLYRGLSGNCAAYSALGISTCESKAPNSAIPAEHGVRVDHAVTVGKPAAEVYRFWRDFENLPLFMTHLVDVNTSVGGRSHWIAKGPLGIKFEWEAEIVADREAEVISWKSLDGADVDTAGSVHFTQLPDGRGTEVRVTLKYDPPAGKIGAAIAKLIGQSPEAQIKADLERFKVIIETGKRPESEAKPAAHA